MDLLDPILDPRRNPLAALAEFVRRQLGDLPRWPRPDDAARAALAAQQVAVVIMTAAAPFAPTSYARARLLRQLHASGLLSTTEREHAVSLLEIADGA